MWTRVNDRLLPTSSMGIEMYNLVITLYNDDTLSRGGSDGDQRPTLRTFTLENPCFQELKPNQPSSEMIFHDSPQFELTATTF